MLKLVLLHFHFLIFFFSLAQKNLTFVESEILGTCPKNDSQKNASLE